MDLMRWLSKAPRWFGWRDVAHLLSPFAPLVTTADFIVRHDPHRLEDDLAARDPELLAWMAEGARLLAQLFRVEVYGTHHLPATGPALLVANHNGGLVPLDGLFTLMVVCERFGPERALHPLAHDLVFYDRIAHRFAARAGFLRAGHASAERALGEGHMVLVYPGGDVDSFRPFRERHRVELAGRKGFLSLALATGVPIIPVVATGTHEQWVVLSRGDRLAEALGTGRRFRTKVLPLAWSLPFGLGFGLVPYVPLPAQTSLAFGAPLTWPDLEPAQAHDPAALDRAYGDVVGAMQGLLDTLAHERVPFLGQPAERRREVALTLG